MQKITCSTSWLVWNEKVNYRRWRQCFLSVYLIGIISGKIENNKKKNSLNYWVRVKVMIFFCYLIYYSITIKFCILLNFHNTNQLYLLFFLKIFYSKYESRIQDVNRTLLFIYLIHTVFEKMEIKTFSRYHNKYGYVSIDTPTQFFSILRCTLAMKSAPALNA